MKLHHRSLLIIVASLTILACFLLVTARLFVLHGYEELEAAEISQRAHRGLELLQRELGSLEHMLMSVASDDQNRIRGILEDGYDLALIIESDGKIIRQVSLPGTEDLMFLLASTNEPRSAKRLLTVLHEPESVKAGFYRFHNKILLIGIRTLTSDASATPQFMVLGRWLESQDLQALGMVVGADSTIIALSGEQIGVNDFGFLSKADYDGSVVVHPLSRDEVGGYALLDDIFGVPAAVFEAKIDRELYRQGRATVRYYVMAVVLAVLVTGLVFLWLMDKHILSRLDLLNETVSKIGHSSNLNERVEIGGQDELTDLATNFNDMLDKVQLYQADLERTRDELEQRFLERTKELHATQQQVIEQERLRALGQMASGIAHDFNNALATILGACELLLMEKQQSGQPVDDDDFLHSIHTAARDAADAVSRLREFYRYRQPEDALKKIALNPLVMQVISMTEPMWKDQAQGRGILIRIKTELEEVPDIAGAGSELREMLTNLIFNAVDAMPSGGEVTISTTDTQTHVILSVKDTGTGMTEDVRKRCLEPFFTTKGNDGTGLGLAMVHGIIRRHEARLDIQTSPGKGTTFSISFPLVHDSSIKKHETVDISPPPPLKVLLIDDVPSVRQMVRSFLIADNHEVVDAENGLDGLTAFHEDEFDLIITDRGMPEMGGDHFVLEVRKTNKTIPIIMLTGFGEMMRSAGEHPEGVDLIVSKPVTIKMLRRSIMQVINGITFSS